MVINKNQIAPVYDTVDDIRNDFAQKITTGDNFIYTKLGDGEVACLQGIDGRNCDGQEYSYMLSKNLADSFRYMSSFKNAHFAVWPGCEEIARRFGINNHSPTYSYVFLHHEGQGMPTNLYKSIQSSCRKKIFVRPQRLSGADSFLGVSMYVSVKENDAYADMNYVIDQIKDQLTPGCILLICAGLAAKVILSRALSINQSITCIDIGSGLDNLFYGITRFPIGSDPRFPGQIPTKIVREAYGLTGG